MRKKKLKLPDNTTPMNFRYDKRQAALLRRICGMYGKSMTDVITELLDKWIEDHQGDLPARVIAEVEAAVI